MKKHFVHKDMLILISILYPTVFLVLVIAIVFFSVDSSADKNWIYILVGAIADFVICIPVLIYGTGTIRFDDDMFVYKSCFFSKRCLMKYDDISKIFISFTTHPVGLKRAVSKAIYVCRGKHPEYKIDLGTNVIKEFLHRTESKKIEVEFNSFLSFRKKYRILLYPYLNEKSKLIVKQTYPLEVAEFERNV